MKRRTDTADAKGCDGVDPDNVMGSFDFALAWFPY